MGFAQVPQDKVRLTKAAWLLRAMKILLVAIFFLVILGIAGRGDFEDAQLGEVIRKHRETTFIEMKG